MARWIVSIDAQVRPLDLEPNILRDEEEPEVPTPIGPPIGTLSVDGVVEPGDLNEKLETLDRRLKVRHTAHLMVPNGHGPRLLPYAANYARAWKRPVLVEEAK
jgi:hypothetical protein